MKKRPRKSALANEITASSSPTPEPGSKGADGKPFAKRARFAADDGDVATEFADMEEERDVEDYDEYPDEDGADENAEDEEEDAAKGTSGGLLVEDTSMPGELEELPAEQVSLDFMYIRYWMLIQSPSAPARSGCRQRGRRRIGRGSAGQDACKRMIRCQMFRRRSCETISLVDPSL